MTSVRKVAGNPRVIGYSIVLLCAVIMGVFATSNIKLTVDSMRYSLVSEQIAAGNGVRVPVVDFWCEATVSEKSVPFLVQPPLYPAVLALMGGVNPQRLWPAKILNVLAYVTTVLFSTLLAERFGRKFVAFLLGFTVCCCYKLLLMPHYIWSESLFIAFVIVSIWCLIKSNTSRYHSAYLGAAGIFAGAAISTRFAGVALLPLFMWELLQCRLRKESKSTYLKIIFAMLIPIAVTVILFTRNYILCGNIRGFNAPATNRSLYQSICGVIEAILYQFGINNSCEKLLLIALAIALIVSIWLAKKKRQIKILASFKPSFEHIFIFVFSYIVLIIYTMYKYQPVFEQRFFAPLIPFILIIVYVSIASVVNFFESKNNIKNKQILVIVLLCFLSAVFALRTIKKNRIFRTKQQNTFVETQTLNWLTNNLSTKNIITTNMAYHLSFYGRYPTFRLPNREHNKNRTIPADMDKILPARMSEISSEYLVLFCNEDGLSISDYGHFTSMLSKRDFDAGKFLKVFDCNDGVVYRLRSN